MEEFKSLDKPEDKDVEMKEILDQMREETKEDEPGEETKIKMEKEKPAEKDEPVNKDAEIKDLLDQMKGKTKAKEPVPENEEEPVPENEEEPVPENEKDAVQKKKDEEKRIMEQLKKEMEREEHL